VESRAPGRRTLPDLAGAGLAALAIGALTLGIVQGEEWGWTSAAVLGAFAAALAFGASFVRRCRWHELDRDLLAVGPGRPEHAGHPARAEDRSHDIRADPVHAGRVTQRKPMWLVDVSTASPWRAAGR
jgi:hypothetical protein